MYKSTKIDVSNKDEIALSREMVFSRMELNPVQMDVISMLLAQIGKPEDDDLQRNYRLTTVDFAELKHYKDLDSTYNKIKKRIAEGGIEKIGFKIYRNENDWVAYNWFTSVRYFNGTLMLHVNPEVKELLVDLKKSNGYKMFASLQYVLPMQSYYSKRIYMLCRQYVSGGAIYSIKWDDFKAMLAIPDTYSPQQIKARVLDKAKEEIGKTDLEIDYELKTSKGKGRGGKKIDAISFTIRRKSKDLTVEQQKAITHKKQGDYQKVAPNSPSKNQFNDFPQNHYDFDELEKHLLK